MLKNKVAVITGAASGIGRETAELFRENRATVIGLDISCGDGCRDGIDYYRTDVSDPADCERCFAGILDRYAGVDILVNCAGITRDSLAGKMSEEQFDSVISVNLKGVWNMGRLFGPHMQARKAGSIINISSVVGIYGNIGQSNYAASKAGVIGLTKSWAKEFAYRGGGVRVNAIAPGYTLTDMLNTVPRELLDKFAAQTMLGRLAEPREIANVALFLASGLSSYITGTTIMVDGGMRL